MQTSPSQKLRNLQTLQFQQRQRKKKPRRKSRLQSKTPTSVQRPKTRRFEESPLGFGLMYNCPIEYPFIVAQAKANGPSADFIEAMSYRCDNPWFRTIEFREALIEYRKYRLRGEKISVSAADRIKILEGNRSLLQEMSRHS